MQCKQFKTFHSIPNKHQSSFNAMQFEIKAMQPQILDEQSPSLAESPKSPKAKPTLRKEPSFSRWCGESVEDPPLNLGHSPSPSFDRISIDSDDFELPLLGSPSEIDAQHTSNSFRQRSHTANDNDHNKDRKLFGLDVESGLHVSQSQTKLDQLENDYNLYGYCSGSSSWIAVVARTVFYILIWYSLSTCLTLYNKALLGDKLGKFPAPLLMNTFHFGLQAVLSKVIGCFQLREGTTPITWRDYFVKVVPTAIGTALDVNLSNASLVFISVTFATMCKSASPIFLLLFAFAFRLESPSIKLLGIIFIISIGVLLTGKNVVSQHSVFHAIHTIARETEFNFFGFMLVMLSAVMAGFRWSLTQILLQKDIYGLKNPITLMSNVSPVMTAVTAILSLLMDPWHEFHRNIYFDNSWHILRSCLLMLVGGSLAFLMVLTEYILISATSAITVTVAGVVKEAVTILVAVVYFHDSFTWLKGTGLLTIMVGVGLFNWYKYQKFKRGQPNEKELSSMATANLKYVIIDEADSQDDDHT